jgi:hypothetical protein
MLTSMAGCVHARKQFVSIIQHQASAAEAEIKVEDKSAPGITWSGSINQIQTP